MLLEARNLTRYYGGFAAVQGLDFGIERGQIVGLLGPNGAGKTTTMRMLTGFLAPSDGTALVAGIDVRKRPLEALRHIGYMPESNPLHDEMRVREYLVFRAELKGLPRRVRRSRIATCAEVCQVSHISEQIIGTLSKGYRQRVGLADAMLARPDILILDEPTLGLDPNQVRQTRALIRSLGENQTVLISTHILAEAEAVCQRVLILVRGRLVADDTPQNLAEQALHGQVSAELQGKPYEIAAALRRLEGVRSVSWDQVDGWARFSIAAEPGTDPRPAVSRTAAENNWPLRELTISGASLEQVFEHFTRPADGDEER
jgi:ABC-2 type transport system ATP-binding protein